MSRRLFSVILALSLSGCSAAPEDTGAPEPAWVELFDGATLDRWIVKITGAETGDDPWGTFRVEDGLLTVGYEQYDSFDGRFGHLFFEEPFSDYELRVEYRFVGEQVQGGPGWALRNSGVMFHAQSPGSMLRDQDFPISLEAQFLGGNGVEDRPTSNLCTPGTHVKMIGELVEVHCITAEAPTFHGEQWVTADLIVRGGSSIVHVIDGDTVLAYGFPLIGGGVVDGFDPSEKEDGRALTSGFIALQSESHPIQFRRVALRRLSN